MAPRRPRSTSNVSANNTISRAPTSSPQLRKQFVLASDSIYQNNLNVIKRRDPSIVSILDQFSHVCLYSFNGKLNKWLREGFEGSIFIVEHHDQPTYGFYILNRLGTGDYSRRIYPEDDVEVMGNYLMYRYYHDYTQKRLAMGLPYPLPPQFRPAFDREFARDHSLPDEPETPVESTTPPKEKKGTSVTLGLWQFPQDGRVESLKDVMLRLHAYVQKGQPYPEQYCYGPGRPPPPPPSNGQNGQLLENRPLTKEAFRSGSTQPVPNSAGSEVDKLFAKLQPSPMAQTAAPAAAAPSGTSIQSLYNTLVGQPSLSPSQTRSSTAASTVPAAIIPPNTSARGLALLDTIFASALPPGQSNSATFGLPSQPPSHPQPANLPPQPEQITIVSPKPQSSALPQILTQNVISTLLGLDPGSASSRSSSAALSSGSSRRSGNRRYEGGDELSEPDATSDAGFSTSSTVLDADVDPAILARGSPQIPSFSYPNESDGFVQGAISVQGDVTPRAPARGIGPTSPLLTAQRSGQSLLSVSGLLNAAAETARTTNNHSSASNRPSHSNSESPAPQRTRQLVPFSSDHELWPYPRAPLNDNDSSDADVVELDFSDTRALSDPTLFEKKQSKQAKGERRKKSRRERAADRQREREAIEDAWDDPTKGQVTMPGTTPTSATSSLSLSAMMEAAAAESAQPKVNGHSKPAPNGKASIATAPTTNGPNGHAMTTSDIARETLISTLSTYPKAPPRDLDRKQFVQEVLSLIYTDKTFVEQLYEQYTNGGR